MGFEQPKPSSSSTTAVIVLSVVLLVAIVGTAAAAVLFWNVTTIRQARAREIEHRMLAEVERALVEKKRAVVQLKEAENIAQRAVAEVRRATSAIPIEAPHGTAPPVETNVKLDRDGNASIDGKTIGLDDLKAELVKSKDETSNTFVVKIDVDSQCAVNRLVSLLRVCQEVGDIDFQVVSSGDSDSSVEATASVSP